MIKIKLKKISNQKNLQSPTIFQAATIVVAQEPSQLTVCKASSKYKKSSLISMFPNMKMQKLMKLDNLVKITITVIVSKTMDKMNKLRFRLKNQKTISPNSQWMKMI